MIAPILFAAISRRASSTRARRSSALIGVACARIDGSDAIGGGSCAATRTAEDEARNSRRVNMPAIISALAARLRRCRISGSAIRCCTSFARAY
jgi:TPP-dependent pyruvate/acetoin dehydrogenase alpha subunit